MGFYRGPHIIRDGLILAIDPSSERSFKGGNSLIDYSDWKIGTGSETNFSANGTSAENERLMYEGPFGNTICWKAIPDAVSGADGGWNTSSFSINNTKLYRFSVWVKRPVIGSDGRFYFGCHGYGTTNGVYPMGSGTLNTNPYFWYSTNPCNSDTSIWTLIIGHIWPYNTAQSSVHEETGRYTISGGKVSSILDFIWHSSSTTANYRSYLYYTTDTSVSQLWCYPRVDLVDGTEPTINDLLTGAHNLRDLSNTDNDSLMVNGFDNDGTLSLDGIKQYIQLPIGSGRNLATQPITICAWVKSNVTDGSRMWLDWGGQGTDQRLYSGLSVSGANNMGIQNSTWNSGAPSDTEWHYQVITMDGSNAKSYDNGKYLYTKTYTSYTIGGDLRIGGRSNTIYQWNGSIGPVMFYERALSPNEIIHNFNAQKGRFGL